MWEWERSSLHRAIGGRLGPQLRYYGILLFPSLFVCLLQPTHTHLHTHITARNKGVRLSWPLRWFAVSKHCVKSRTLANSQRGRIVLTLKTALHSFTNEKGGDAGCREKKKVKQTTKMTKSKLKREKRGRLLRCGFHERRTTNRDRDLPLFIPRLLPYQLLPSYQDVLEAEVIVMTRCWTLRIGNKQAATVPFPRALWQRETG